MKWYTYLKSNSEVQGPKGKALMDYENIDANNFIVCQKLKFLSFGRFNNYLDFAKYMLKNTPENQKCYYETIFGDKGQRPYFDIEFYTKKDLDEGGFCIPENEADESVDFLVKCIFNELQDQLGISNPLEINKSHIFVFTSHSTKEVEGIKKIGDKRSYHIVVEGFSVSNYKDNKEFHDRVIKRMPEKWKDIVDHSMYKSLQQFRIVGNTKWQNDRYKILSEELTMNYRSNSWIPKLIPESDNQRMILLLEASLVSQTSSCIMLNCKPEEKKYFNSRFLSDGEELTEGFNPLTPDDITEALKLCYKKFEMEFGDRRFPFNYLKTIEDNGISSLVLLKRLKPSMCSVCNRNHENENPYLVIAGENRDVFLDCRRNGDNKKLLVGSLGTVSKNIIKPEEPVVKKGLDGITITRPPKKDDIFDVKKFIKGEEKGNKKILSFSLSDD
jgi:hypothetical protein